MTRLMITSHDRDLDMETTEFEADHLPRSVDQRETKTHRPLQGVIRIHNKHSGTAWLLEVP